MIEALKKLLHRENDSAAAEEARAAQTREKDAAARAHREAAVERAATLSNSAQTRRDAGDRTGAAIFYAEALTHLRDAEASEELAHVLSRAADVRSEMRDYGVAGTMIDEAMRLYGAFDPPAPLPFANACRVAAMNDERRARSSWKQALNLYASVGSASGIDRSGRASGSPRAAPQNGSREGACVMRTTP